MLAATRRWLASGPGIILIALMAMASLIWAFFEIADAVGENETDRFDRLVMQALRNPADMDDPLGPVWVQELARDITALGGVGVLTFFVVAAAGYLWLARDRGLSVFLLASVSTGVLLSQGLKTVFDRARPDIVSLETAVYTASFPSGHSLMAAVVYLTLAVLLARKLDRKVIKTYILGLAMFLVITIGLSRIYLGVHWPTDVLAGWVMGAAWALLCGLFARWLAGRGSVGRETAT
ncbi:phosphatase PAP2 family protein [Sulfitobacter sp. F26169L]|uniref:phosphatase PAP2 family protein n=1 Tax=Sulfitobacter sp. F26169L TaxID=2996015 RepID=UPI0022608FCC|nr:phosphatase PAP2 family protein [Sulfitobacter sp. F26169L]MCX7564982.1 phosphatase PAP2 family protein [Sulfitobacter sp. F26169L]